MGLIMSNRSIRRALVAALLALSGLALGGCGGVVHVALTAQRADGITAPDRRPGTARFDRPESAISFDYPAGMTERTDVIMGRQAGRYGERPGRRRRGGARPAEHDRRGPAPAG
jgi:hypothetical protein